MSIKNTVIGLILAGFLFFMAKNILFNDVVSYKTESLVIGIAADYAPYVSINQYGQYEGFDVDLAHGIADMLQKDLILKDMGSMAPLFIALEQGTIDAIMWGLSITEERLKKVDFVHYEGSDLTSLPLLFWNTPLKEIKTFADISGATVCVEPTSIQYSIIQKYADQLTIYPTEKVDDAFLALQQGRADAAFLDPAIAKKFKTKYPELTIVEIPLLPEDQVYGMGIAIKKTNPNLTAEIDQAIAQLKEQGFIKELEKKWRLV